VDCFVKNYQASASEQKLPNYISATISFSPPSNSSDPWWKNSEIGFKKFKKFIILCH